MAIFGYPRWPLAAMLDFWKLKGFPLDRPSPKTTHKLGDVENECTSVSQSSHKFVLFAIFVPTLFTIGGNLTKFRQK